MHAIGHVADGHIGHRPVRKQGVPHLARHLAVAPAHAIGMPAGTQGHHGHAAGLLRQCGVDPAQRQKAFPVAQQIGNAAQHGQHFVALVRLIAGRHRGVGGEHHLLTHPGPGGVPPGFSANQSRCWRLGPLLRQQLKHPQHRVPLVQVVDRGCHAHGPQRTHTAHAQHRVLRQPHGAVALVQARGDPAAHWAVFGQIGVQQVQRHPAHVDPPDVGGHAFIVNGHGHTQGPAIVARDLDTRQALGVGIQPILVLAAGDINALVEIAGAVHQPHAHHGQRQV